MTEAEKTKRLERLRELLGKVLARRKKAGDNGEPVVRKIHAAGIYKGGAPYFSKCAAYNILKSRKDMARLWRYRKGWAAAGK